jgi:predicted DNA-binding transcriptional regulator YafY
VDRTERFYLIDRLLDEHGLVTRQQFLDALNVSLATFKRDLEYMRDRLHAPIHWNNDRQGYEFTVPDGVSPPYELPGLWFNQSEIFALLTMQQLLAGLDPGLLASHVAPLRSRLESLLEKGNVDAAEVNKRIRILAQAARPSTSGVFAVIAHGVLRRTRLRIKYLARSTGETTQREVSPQRLVHYRDNWYLDAWCHTRDDLRTFSLDAIGAAVPLDEKARLVSDALLDRRLGSGYGIFSGENVEWASLRFTPQRARWVAHEQWHPAQCGRLESDGTYILEVPFADPRELMMDILKHGAHVAVLGPDSLRDLWVDEIRRMDAAARSKQDN